MNIKVEKLSLKDLTQFWSLFNKTIKQDFPGYSSAVVDYFLTNVYSQYNFQQWLMTGWKIVLLAKNNDKVLGFAVIDKPYGGVCFLRWLGVAAEARKKGVGKKLIMAWEDYGHKLGCHKLEVAGQPGAKGFYQKVGLNLEGKREQSFFGIDQYIFGKVIAQPKDAVMIKD